MTAPEARMSPHDETIHRLTLLLADAITGDAQGRGSDDYAQREGRGRVLATVDDCEYVITIAPNTELPGVTRKALAVGDQVRVTYEAKWGERARHGGLRQVTFDRNEHVRCTNMLPDSATVEVIGRAGGAG